MRDNLNLKMLATIVLFVGLSVFSIQAQTRKKSVSKSDKTAVCTIGTTKFKCPNDFVREQSVDKNTLLFRRDDDNLTMYFFITITEKKFDDAKIRNTIAGKIGGKPTDLFRWNDVKEPFVMDLESKYEKKIVSRIGYNYKLVNFISRYFEFNGKTIVLGYGYDADGDGLVKLFERGNAIGDNAIGCNAIATTLNSITKEKKGDLQYCSISALGISR